MNKIIGKLNKEELKQLSLSKDNMLKLKNQQEFLNMKLENVNLKLTLEESIRKNLIKDIMIKFNIKNLSSISIKDSGEIISKEEKPEPKEEKPEPKED
jgi:hypothetical protein